MRSTVDPSFVAMCVSNYLSFCFFQSSIKQSVCRIVESLAAVSWGQVLLYFKVTLSAGICFNFSEANFIFYEFFIVDFHNKFTGCLEGSSICIVRGHLRNSPGMDHSGLPWSTVACNQNSLQGLPVNKQRRHPWGTERVHRSWASPAC